MRNDDDVLGIDLDAWQAPSPPAGIADRVLERVRREATATTAGVPQALPVEPERRVVTAGKRWWIAGGAVLAAAAAATFVTFGMARAPASGQGHVVAARRAHLALGPS